MNTELFIENLFSTLVSGDRFASRKLVDAAFDHGIEPTTLARRCSGPRSTTSPRSTGRTS